METAQIAHGQQQIVGNEIEQIIKWARFGQQDKRIMVVRGRRIERKMQRKNETKADGEVN